MIMLPKLMTIKNSQSIDWDEALCFGRFNQIIGS